MMFVKSSNVFSQIKSLICNRKAPITITQYDIVDHDGKFYAVHSDDQPFLAEKIIAHQNVMPVFIGDTLEEVKVLINGAVQTLLEFETRRDITSGMVFNGYETLDCIRRKLAMIVEAQSDMGKVEDGHFYSPIPSLGDIQRYSEKHLIGVARSIKGIDLQEKQQKEMLDYLVSEYDASALFPKEKSTGKKYYHDNSNFAYYDAFVLQSFIRFFKPRKIIETGSGFSSCVMHDTNKHYFEDKIDIAHIEPYPKLLYSLTEADPGTKLHVLETGLQKVDLKVFEHLDRNDILFIDTSHVTKVDSDVNHYLFEILPILNDGVIIHIHDIGLDFNYEVDDMLKGRAWNEAYILRAFLTYNSNFKILYWNPFMLHFYPDVFQEQLPLCWENPGGSIWLVKESGKR